jgi:DedD protein
VHDLSKADVLRGQLLAQQYQGEMDRPKQKVAMAVQAAKPAPAKAPVPKAPELKVSELKAAEAKTVPRPVQVTEAAKQPEKESSILASIKAFVAPLRQDKAVAVKKAPMEQAPLVQAPLEKAAVEQAPPQPALLEKTPAKKAPAIVTKQIGKGEYLVQLGLFRNPGNISRIHAKLQGQGLKVMVEKVDLGGKRYQRLRVGPYVSKAEARSMAKRVDGILRIRSLVVYHGTSSQAEATGGRKNHL